MSVRKAAASFSPEVRDRAVRLVLEHQGEHVSQWPAMVSVAAKIGCTTETVVDSRQERGRPGEQVKGTTKS